MLTMAAARGFTIIELLVGLTLLAVLLGLGAPAMGTYLQNSKLATAAASYYTGLQTARTEAIRRNTQAEFVLTDTAGSASAVANSLTPTITGRSWVVRAASAASGVFVGVEAKPAAEGEGGQGAAIQVVGSASSVAFNGFGQTVGNVAFTIDISNPTAGVCASGGGKIRCRRVVVSPGGQVSACDPVAVTGDSRACPP